MKVILSILFLILNIHTMRISAQEPESFQEAKVLAANRGKPVLMEFLRSG